MADFCKQCSIDIFGEDFRELAGLSTEDDTKNGFYPAAICEGYGWIRVDHDGVCVSSDCNKHHGGPK